MRLHRAETAVLGLLLLLAVACLTVNSAPRRQPVRAQPKAAPVVLNIGDVVQIGTQTFVVTSGLFLAPGGITPPPPPPPPGPIFVEGVRNSQRDPTTTTPSHTLIYVNGRNFGAAPGKVTIASLPATVINWANLEIACIAPVTPTLIAGPIVVSVGTAAGTSPFLFTVTPETVRPPGAAGVVIGTLTDLHGKRLGARPPDGVVRISGSNFGSVPGRVLWQSGQIPVLLWTDTAVDCVIPAGQVDGTIAVQRPDGDYDAVAPLWVVGPVPGLAAESAAAQKRRLQWR